MKRNISIVLALVMVMFLSMSAHAAGVELTDDEIKCEVGLTLEEKLIMKASWEIIELIETHSTIWYSGIYVIVTFDYGVYEDTPNVKESLAAMTHAFQYTDNRVIKVFYMDSDGRFIGHTNKELGVILL